MAFWLRLAHHSKTLPRQPPRLLQLRIASFKSMPQMSAYSTQSAQQQQQQPSWLKAILDNQSPPPRLYAWSPENIGLGSPRSSPQTTSPDDLDRRIFILGVGNMGRLYASYMSNHSPPPPITLVVHRKELLSQWVSSPGIEISRLGELFTNKNFQIEWWTEEAPSQGQVREVAGGKTLRSLLIGTKASTAVPEADKLRRYLDRQSSIAFLQNGMSKLWPPYGEEYMSQRYPDGNGPNLLACVTNHGVYSEGPFKSVHAAPVDSTVGPVLLNSTETPAPSVSYLTEAIATAPLLDAKSVSKADLWVLQLRKLVVNSTINPLSAVLRCKNGILFKNPNGTIAKVIDRLLAESSAVLQALIHYSSSNKILDPPPSSLFGNARDAASPPSPKSLKEVKERLAERFSQQELHTLLYSIGERVGENKSSMFQDVTAGKPTEVQDFNGWIVETATMIQQGSEKTRHDLETPCHRKLIALVESSTIVTEAELGQHFLSL